jgi:hypothetical protein
VLAIHDPVHQWGIYFTEDELKKFKKLMLRQAEHSALARAVVEQIQECMKQAADKAKAEAAAKERMEGDDDE